MDSKLEISASGFWSESILLKKILSTWNKIYLQDSRKYSLAINWANEY